MTGGNPLAMNGFLRLLKRGNLSRTKTNSSGFTFFEGSFFYAPGSLQPKEPANELLEEEKIWGGYGEQDRSNHRSLLQNSVSFIVLFCKRDL